MSNLESETQQLATQLDLKAIDASGRTLEGYAATFGNLDRVGDVIDAKAFDRTLAGNPDVQVFIGHRADSLPVGEAFDIRPDGHGLFTRVKVYRTPDGDALLEVARQRMAAGRSLGMSIGYRTVKERFDSRTKARHLLDVDLVEFSYLASPALAANPQAMVTALKAQQGLPEEAYAFTDSQGVGHLQINDSAHIRAALARFDQTHFPDPETRSRAARRVLAAAQRHAIQVDPESAVAQAAKSLDPLELLGQRRAELFALGAPILSQHERNWRQRAAELALVRAVDEHQAALKDIQRWLDGQRVREIDDTIDMANRLLMRRRGRLTV